MSMKKIYDWIINKSPIVSGIFVILCVTVQSVFLNYFVGEYIGGWQHVLGVILSVFLFIVGSIILRFAEDENVFRSYWLLYIILQWFLVVMFCVEATVKLDKNSFWGPNVFKGTVCGTPFVFMTLICYCYKTIPKERRAFVKNVVILTAIDLFDNAEMMDFLFNSQYNIPEGLRIFIVVLSCLACLSTFVIILELHECPSEGKWNTTAAVIGIFVNISFMGIRIAEWVETRLDISIFLTKNLFFVILDSFEVICYLLYKCCWRGPGEKANKSSAAV